jgi:hypothetical protein
MQTPQTTSFATLRLIAEHDKKFSFPNLRRRPGPPHEPATADLVDWGAHLYSFSWIRHFCTLVNGLVSLEEAGNTPSARVIARSVFELGAHAYYVKKRLKQHIDTGNLPAAWKFFTPIGTESRYINEQHPEESEMFSSPPHISKAINCFGERLPEDAQEGYIFLSEFCHPNVLVLSQYYEWTDPKASNSLNTSHPMGYSGQPPSLASKACWQFTKSYG